MVRSGLTRLPLADLDLLLIENVGNLVCPAEFAVGEDARAMVYAITEGEEKPLKYPVMFRAADVVVVNKIDLLPHLDFDLDRSSWPTWPTSTPRPPSSRPAAGRATASTPGATGSSRSPPPALPPPDPARRETRCVHSVTDVSSNGERPVRPAAGGITVRADG